MGLFNFVKNAGKSLFGGKADAARVVGAVADLDVYIEQPCMTYEESLSIRRRTSLPFVMDEVIGSVNDLTRGIAEDAFDVINLKISKVGGLTKAKLMRDLCVAHGIPMTIEDTWGGDIVTAAIALILFIWAAYGFSGAGRIGRMPLLRTALVAIASIYLLRGLFIIPILIWPQLRSPFNIWSSLIVLGYGLVYAVGTWRVWPSISTNARKSKELVI